MSLLFSGLQIIKTVDVFELTLSNGERALTARLYWTPAGFGSALESFATEMISFPGPNMRVVFLDDLHGQNFPPQWDRQERFSLVLTVLENRPALVAQLQQPDLIGLKFERVVWYPQAGDSFNKLGSRLRRWVSEGDLKRLDAKFTFIDE